MYSNQTLEISRSNQSADSDNVICDLPTITLVGNPFESIGRSEHMRTIWRALAAAFVPASLCDVYGHIPEQAVLDEMGHCQVHEVPSGIRIFHLNGDEIQNAHEVIERRRSGCFKRGYNIVAPAWELPRYPTAWARELDRFDEVWAPTAFVQESLRAAVTVPVIHLPNACQPHVSTLLGKPYFGIPEHRFAILYFFDLRSYTSRKNPWAVIEAFHRLIQARPNAEVQLVLKLNYSRTDPGVVLQIKQRIAAFAGRVTMIDATLSNNETKNLVRCCDCFLSLHRSEGFGRGGAEAMFFAKPVVATGWSGNMDYMNDEVAFPVSYTLVPVHEGEYPEFQGQVWANPNIGEAASVLVKLVDDPAYARNIGARARTHMQQQFSDAALGARYRERLRSIAGNAANHVRIYAKATPATSWIKLQSFARAGIAYFSTIAPV